MVILEHLNLGAIPDAIIDYFLDSIHYDSEQ